MAEQLVAAMTGEFDPSAYRDEYREALMGVIQRKIEGAEVVQAAEAPAGGALVDLMAALEASVAVARAARTAEPAVEAQEAETPPPGIPARKPARKRKIA